MIKSGNFCFDMSDLKINSSGKSCPIYKCAISGQEITDASLANMEWLEERPQVGEWRVVGGPISVLKEFRNDTVMERVLGASLRANSKLCWAPLDVWHINLSRNSGIDYEKASRNAENLNML